MRILVTGGGGFLGTHVVKELLKNPSYMVTSFSRHSYAHLEDIGVPTIKGDLTKREDVARALSQGFDAIFHVAAKAGVWGDYQDFYQSNVEGTNILLEEAQRRGIQKFVYTSSPSVVFGRGNHMGVGEEQPYPDEHLSAYAETKAMAEKIVLEKNNSKDFLTVALRPHLIWGPGDPHLIPKVIKQGKAGRLKVVGDGENLVDIIYVENAARAHVQAFEKLEPGSPLCGQTYFLGQDMPVKLWSFINQILAEIKIEPVGNEISLSSAYRIGWLLEKVFKLLGIKKPDPPMTRFIALNLGTHHYYSHAKAKRDFGFKPEISIEEGLKRTFAARNLAAGQNT